MTIDQLARETRPTVTVEEAAKALGVGRTLAWEQIKAGTFPVKPIRIGKRWTIPTRALRALLQIEPAAEKVSDAR